MFDAIRNRWANRTVRCLKCQKKLVAKEKWVCKECKSQMTVDAIVTLILGGVAAATGLHKKNNE